MSDFRPGRNRRLSLSLESLEGRELMTHGLSLNLEVYRPNQNMHLQGHFVQNGSVEVIGQNRKLGGHGSHEFFKFR